MTEACEYPVVHLELRTGNLPRACAFYAELLGRGPERVDTAAGSYRAPAMGGLGGGLGAAGAARRAGGLAERRRLAGGRRDRPLAAEVASHRP
jgi:predicted enzyme related to lactoylglutathione lyase